MTEEEDEILIDWVFFHTYLIKKKKKKKWNKIWFKGYLSFKQNASRNAKQW